MRGRAVRAGCALAMLCATATVAGVGSVATASARTTSDPVTVARRYLAVVLDISKPPDALQEADRFAAPDSDAQNYVQFQVDFWAAVRDAGRVPAAADTVTSLKRKGRSITHCHTHHRDCTTYSGFVLDARGRLVTFTVDGHPLGSRLTMGSGQVASALGASFRLAVAYQTSRDSLNVVGQLEAGGAGTSIDGLGTTYVDPTGRQVAADDVATVLPTPDLANGAHENAAFVFPAAATGGRIRIPITVNGQNAMLELALV